MKTVFEKQYKLGKLEIFLAPMIAVGLVYDEGALTIVIPFFGIQFDFTDKPKPKNQKK